MMDEVALRRMFPQRRKLSIVSVIPPILNYRIYIYNIIIYVYIVYITMGTGSFPGVKRPGRGADHPLPI